MKFVCRMVIAVMFVSMTAAATLADVRYQRGPYTKAEAKAAPEWTVSKWIRGPETTLAQLRGKVVVIDFFQLWCPGCNHFSIPLMGHWEKIFADEIKSGELELISIHTVFEGHSYQSDERLAKFVKEKKMQHPVAVDFLPTGSRLPKTMIDYDTRGTPEIAVIDKNGRLRFQKLGSFDANWATGFIRQLLTESAQG